MTPLSLRLFILPCLLLASPARAEWRVPDCTALVRWAEQVNQHAGLTLRLGGRGIGEQVLPGLMRAPVTTETFGKPVEDWTEAEAQEAGRIIGRCSMQPEGRSQRNLLGQAGQIAQQTQWLLTQRGRSRRALTQALAELEAQPFAPQIMPFLAALPAAGNPAGYRMAMATLRGMPPALIRPARAAVGSVPFLLPPDIDSLLRPAVEAQLASRRVALRQSLIDALAELPGRPDGLVQLDRGPPPALRDALDEAGRAALAEATAARRLAILVEIEKTLEERIAAAPADADGFLWLAALSDDSAYAALPEVRRAALDATIAARAAPLAPVAAEAALAEIAALPRDMNRLPRALHLMQEVTAGLERHGGAELARRFAAESRQAVTALADAALPAFVAFLESRPADETTLRNLGRPPRFLRDLVEALPEAGGRYQAVIAARQQTIANELAAAAAAEHARQEAARAARAAEVAAEAAREAGPLIGRRYRALDGTLELEFLDATRVLATHAGRDLTVAGSYEEIAGNRVIITLPEQNFVVTRAGKRLDGGRLVLERMATP
ncbi:MULTISPECIES: hypothetical protein [Roseomonadaceae]|uniref:Uncharacterized protein n=1 Tax=Falsiroseomonas oleicola TaxID=2801474 RepID=A0ABS6HA18_9PROT|nr:hypothetical protein [Roseomonas oleicola]MBU8545555.1 hypothetical protein [Roseomonas oleicola]